MLLPAILIVLFLPLLAGAEPADEDARRPVVGEAYMEPPPPSAPELVSNLNEYITQRLHTYYLSAQEIYDPDFSGFGPFSYVRLTPVKAPPILAGDIAVYAGGVEGLATMNKDGQLKVWGKYPCSGLRMVPGPAKLLALTPNSPWLAALDQERAVIRMVDLKSCQSAGVWLKAKNKKIREMKLSSFGDWIAVATDNGELFAGPSLGPLKLVSSLPGKILTFGFSSYDGVLIAVDAEGNVVFWGMRPGELLGRADVGKGFQRAKIANDNLVLTKKDGQEKIWNTLSREFKDKQLKEVEQPVIFEFNNGTLALDTKITRWKKTVILKKPLVLLSYSKSKNSLKLADFDGATRYYNATTGLPKRDVEALDWVLLPEGEEGAYMQGDKKYRLADLAYQKGREALFCRYIPRNGFFLWWATRSDSKDFTAKKGSLPKRSCVLDSVQPQWVDLEAGPAS
jgi:hypothetical protein